MRTCGIGRQGGGSTQSYFNLGRPPLFFFPVVGAVCSLTLVVVRSWYRDTAAWCCVRWSPSLPVSFSTTAGGKHYGGASAIYAQRKTNKQKRGGRTTRGKGG
jgi:hypothetical protein